MNRLDLLRHSISNIQAHSYTKIQIDRSDEIATIWLNSPKDLNALSEKMLQDINHAIVSLNEDKSIKVIVLRSKIEKAFCAGADIKGFTQKDLN